MVVRLEGNIGQNKIIFQRISEVGGDIWEATIPRNLIGSYVVELIAIDEAGNIGYATKYILTVDTAHLHVDLIPLPYSAEVIKSDFSSAIKVSDYYAVILDDDCER